MKGKVADVGVPVTFYLTLNNDFLREVRTEQKSLFRFFKTYFLYE
jgi:hypothetical protein